MSEGKVVWQNECGLVISEGTSGKFAMGEMGLFYPDEGREVQVRVSETGTPHLLPQLKGKSVRVTIEVVEGGSM